VAVGTNAEIYKPTPSLRFLVVLPGGGVKTSALDGDFVNRYLPLILGENSLLKRKPPLTRARFYAESSVLQSSSLSTSRRDGIFSSHTILRMPVHLRRLRQAPERGLLLATHKEVEA
jgi:hypothetical protein